MSTPEKRRADWQAYVVMQINACNEKIAAGIDVAEQTTKRDHLALNLDNPQVA